MPQTHVTDSNLTPKQVSHLTSQDAIAAFFAELGYDTSRRATLTPEAIGLAGDSAAAIREIEILSEDDEGFLRVVFVKLRSLTAKSRNDLARVLGKTNVDHLLILTSDFSTLEFVLLHKRRREVRGPSKAVGIQVVPLMVAVDRKAPATNELKALRRFTWTGRDGLEQYDKLRTVFEAAAFTEEYFCNRAPFADHYLLTRLREDPAWKDSPAEAFQAVRDLMKDHRGRWLEKGEQVLREELFDPLFKLLGFNFKAQETAKDDVGQADYLLTSTSGNGKTVAFVYAWDRWLDGPDFNLDIDTPEENPGACVVSALEEGAADWIIVTNGRQWRLYSRAAHSRATNFYEVDLAEALLASGDTDPNEAFRYWWLFFRSRAFESLAEEPTKCWLDAIAEGSRDYAKALGQRLKERVFVTIFPHLAQGFLHDRRQRLGKQRSPGDEELRDIYEATLTLLYRLLFLLYAEARDLLPIREAPYREASLRKIKDLIAEKGGIAESEAVERLRKVFSPNEHELYDRLGRLAAAMDRGDAALNVPIYNGGLFITQPGDGHAREQRIARFLAEHKVPDRFLALAIDRLARDPDDKTHSLVAIDYKSLEVRHLGSIYEGLLEFKLRVAEEDLTTRLEKKKEKFIPLKEAKPKRGRDPIAVVRKGEVYLSNDKAERKASGSYYTPDPIVEYIVEHTVGPVLAEKLEALRPAFRKVRRTFDNEVQKATAYPVKKPSGDTWDPREFAGEKTYAAHQDLVERLFDFRTLDPAMGSGHFLVEAVDFITDRLLAFLNQFPVNPVTFMLDRTRRNILEALGEQGVAVDPDKLTEVNLLKRHVLKRCIYGVDLNPMAVELAKVSLWLDAFTIGAPLSFLDHHLRCGNSLIGAKFKDLQEATKGQLFGIDYEPLLRAIHHVLHVNTMADATAAEVKQSQSEYSEARDELSGYQVVLDLLVAKHFGVPDAPELLSHGGGELDLSSRSKFLQSLDDVNELATVERVEAVAREPQNRFFHWEIEFPEVFFGFEDAQQRRIRHKDEITEGSAGFDAVVGNPPYVRQETIKSLKEYLQTCFATYNAANDLYVYFQEREIELLQANRRMGMIVSNKWMRAGYGEKIREYLKHVAQPVDLIDFGHTPIFPDADTFPCVLVAARRPAKVNEVDGNDVFQACPVPRADWQPQMDLSAYCRTKRYTLPTRLMRREVWSLEDPRIHALLEKIRNTGVPLKEYVGSSPVYGIKTGFNDAFYIDAATRDRLIREDKRSAEIIRPLLRGRDIDRWRPRKPNTFLILARRGIEIEKYPAIKRHLSQFRERLEPKPVGWTPSTPNEKWSGRASGSYRWYELQASPGDDSLAALEGPKIVYQEIQFHSWFAFDPGGLVVNNKVFLLPNATPALLGVLCSPLMWWFLTRTLPHMKDEALTPAGFLMELVRVQIGEMERREQLAAYASKLMCNADQSHSLESECCAAFRIEFRLQNGDDRIVDWLSLAEDAFISRASALFETSPPSATQLAKFQIEFRTRQVELLKARLKLEQQVATLVEDAYGLTPEERQLLRDTRPIRDPLDVLEAKIAGKGSLAGMTDDEAASLKKRLPRTL